MKNQLRDIHILGVHPVRPTAGEFEEALQIMKLDRSDADLKTMRNYVRGHFDGLYLIEVQLRPPKAKLDWGEITQPRDDRPRENWQVPWDERPIDESAGLWAFFLHYVNLDEPLSTPVGDRQLPSPTPLPSRLASIRYELP
jgi:hypothetical protein